MRNAKLLGLAAILVAGSSIALAQEVEGTIEAETEIEAGAEISDIEGTADANAAFGSQVKALAEAQAESGAEGGIKQTQMMTADHPNALWLAHLYQGVIEIQSDTTLAPSARDDKQLAHQRSAFARVSPQFVIHTGGVRLAATGAAAFAHAYGARRMAIMGDSFRLLEVDQILADDLYGIARILVRLERNGKAEDFISIGGWRFEGGLAVEHWEMVPGPLWDEAFLVADPQFDGDARDFWLAK